MNDAVVAAKGFRNDLVEVFKKSKSIAGSLDDVDDDKIQLVKDMQKWKSQLCWCTDNIKNITEKNKHGEELDNAKDEKKFYELMLTLYINSCWPL